MTAASLFTANVTVRSNPCGPVRSTLTPPRNVSVAIQDASNQIQLTNTDNIQLQITSGTGTAGAVLTCLVNPVNAQSGVASFAQCKVDLPGGADALAASGGDAFRVENG